MKFLGTPLSPPKLVDASRGAEQDWWLESRRLSHSVVFNCKRTRDDLKMVSNKESIFMFIQGFLLVFIADQLVPIASFTGSLAIPAYILGVLFFFLNINT
ncbi:MAG: hypothetical protein ACE5DI_06315, partial [Candidatus Micrarchaeia archaeon]